ncbi:TonB-dependent receptor [Sphingomonas sp. LR60]|uniref:TonB-dependent receptor n=1 Tax=Sphingomonas sp. LR60 TaxID=3050233 RepID=UPI002FE0DC45
MTAQQSPPIASDGQVRSGIGDTGDEVVVTGIRASIEASLAQKRRSDMVSEVITAQDIGKFPDKNVADSLGRLTGVNVVTGSSAGGGFGENQSVSIRGTDPELNLTLLDGHSLATGDWFVLDQANGGRSFNFSMFPSEIVGSLEVYKSAQADIPEGGIGGTINVHSRLPLDLPAGTFNLTAQGAYNDLSVKWKPQVSAVASWKNKAGTFGILAAGFYEARAFRRDGQEFLGYSTQENFNNSGVEVAYPALIGDAYFTQERIRKGGTVSVQFKPTDRLELTATGLYTRMSANNVNVNSMAWTSKLVGDRSTPGTPGYALGKYATKAYGGVTYLTSAAWAATGAGGAPSFGRVQDDIFRSAFSSTWNGTLEAKWKPADGMTVHANVGYTEGRGATTKERGWETYWQTGMSYALQGKGAVLSYPGLPTDPTSSAYLKNYFSGVWGGSTISPDREFYTQGDLEQEFPDSSWLRAIKTGARFTNHRRAVDSTGILWAGNETATADPVYGAVDTNQIGLFDAYAGATTPGNFNRRIGVPSRYSLADLNKVEAVLATRGGTDEAFYPPSSFSVEEKDTAFYAMARVGNDSNWRGNLGLRSVRTDIDTLQYSPNVAPTIINKFGEFGAVKDGRAYWDVLPSANLTYNATDKLLLRGAVAKVMSRPGYAQLAGAFSVDDLSLTGSAGGNPRLDPFRAWQFNLAAEFYYAPQSLFSIGIFALDISNYITTTTSKRFYRTVLHPNGANFLVEEPVNGGGGFNKGAEVNWQQPIWGGFGMIANYTYSDAKRDRSAVAEGDHLGRDIDGNSKHTWNLTGYFENDLVSTRLAYSYRSKFRSGIDRATAMWQDGYGQLDGSLLVHVTPHLALSADAQNIGNAKLYYFVGDRAIPRAYYDNGRTFYLGVRVTY